MWRGCDEEGTGTAELDAWKIRSQRRRGDQAPTGQDEHKHTTECHSPKCVVPHLLSDVLLSGQITQTFGLHSL